MERFTIEQSTAKDEWICTDKTNGVVCKFKNKQFNDTQKFSLLSDIKQPCVQVYTKVCGEIENWLKENHSDKIV
jgi:hypothetical protein